MKDIKVFGTFLCPGCISIKNLLDRKGVDYNFFNVAESDGLAELASLGLSDELTIPIVTIEDEKTNLTGFEIKIKALPDKEEG